METRLARYVKPLSALLLAVAVAAVGLLLAAEPSGSQAAPQVSFSPSALKGESSTNPTSLQFGPDGRLYVAQQDGAIKAYTVVKNGPSDYSVTNTETLTLIKSIPNHNDDGTVCADPALECNKRQVTGLLAAGTAQAPVLYVSSSDPRIGGKSAGTDTGLDTNSGVLSRLEKTPSGWHKTDLVRGLPRSEENHSVNGMQLSPDGSSLYLAVGGNTNQGAPSNNFAMLPEVALSAAILEVDLAAIGGSTHDLPTLDDPSRPGSPDPGDPFGGNDGGNQAKESAHVRVHAPGFRNAYDVVVAESGKMYTVDNGGNAGWGDVPEGEGPAGACTNAANEPGATNQDAFYHVAGAGFYGGHPNPTRGNKANGFGGQSPVAAANPAECDYDKPASGAIATFPASTNGLAEYTASNFGGALKGDLLAASFNGTVYRIELNDSGTAIAKKSALLTNFGNQPLDVTAQGDGGPFPGTIWAAVYGTDNIQVFEPSTTGTNCDTANPDSDGDGYKNDDETASGTDPCSAASVPPDYDNDKISNKTDPDDDNDGTPDTSDPFALDKNNGATANLPVRYTWDPGAANAGGLEGNFGFTGLMNTIEPKADYATLYDPSNMTVGGAGGLFTVDAIPGGDAVGTFDRLKPQRFGFQLGVNVGPASGTFTAHTRIAGPFKGISPENFQAMGLFIGNGDQDNYVKLNTVANKVTNPDGTTTTGGVELAKEFTNPADGQPAFKVLGRPKVTMPGPTAVDLFLTVDPAAKTVQASYVVMDESGAAGPRTNVGGPVDIPAEWLNGTTKLAVGFISTSNNGNAPGAGTPFAASWDFVEVEEGNGTLAVEESPPPDTTAPNTTITAGPGAGSTTSSGTAEFGFSSSETGSSFECSLDGAAFSACSSPKQYANLSTGEHTFRVRAIDKAGNADSTPAERKWTVKVTPPDTTAPQTTITAGPPAYTKSRTASLSFSSSEANSTFRCSLDGAPFAACVSPKGYQNLPDGHHTFRVLAVDKAGNQDTTPAARSWTVDNATPVVLNPLPKPESRLRDRTPLVTATVRDRGSELTKVGIRFYVDGRLKAFTYAPTTDRLRYQAARPLAYGTHRATISVRDAAGNVTTRSWRFNVVRR